MQWCWSENVQIFTGQLVNGFCYSRTPLYRIGKIVAYLMYACCYKNYIFFITSQMFNENTDFEWKLQSKLLVKYAWNEVNILQKVNCARTIEHCNGARNYANEITSLFTNQTPGFLDVTLSASNYLKQMHFGAHLLGIIN